ncbi:unnamed protein product, partial [Polarella glacialis]
MKPKAGYDYLATAAHFAAESSTGTNVNVCTTDDFTKSVDALVFYIDPDNEEMKIAYPTLLFDRNITDGRAMMCSVLTLSIGNNQGMGDVEYGKIYDIYFPPAYLRLFDGPNCNVVDMWRILNRGMSNGGLIVGTIIKPKLGLQPKPFGEACYAFWQGGDFIKNDEPQGNQVFCQMNECIPEVVKAMRAAIKETGSSKLFSASITADDPNEMIARGKYVLSHLSDGIIEFAKTHEELKGAFLTFQKDADQIYPGWKEKLGYTGESSVQAATFDWAKKAAAAPYIGGWVYAKTPKWRECTGTRSGIVVTLAERNHGPDGTAMNLAGNETNHPEKIKKDMHTPGSTLPKSFYMNAVGYLPDGTPLNRAGNEVNHPEKIGPDPHKNGSPLPPPLKGYVNVNDIGYTPDGTPMDKAGNLSVKKLKHIASVGSFRTEHQLILVLGLDRLLGSSSQAFVSTPATAASASPNLRASSAVSQTQQPAASSAPASSAVPVIACGGLAAAALAGQRASRRQNRSSALPTVVPVQSSVQRRALDQSSRYADL